jgi:regulatory protein
MTAYRKAASFCAYRERCHREVREKLHALKVPTDEAGEIMAQLIGEGYLNEERYARAFCGGKFRIKRWGRIKIRMALEQNDVSEYCIRKGMEEIEEEAYIRVLRLLIGQRSLEHAGEDPTVRKQRIIQYLMGRGFEAELIKQNLDACQ